MRVPNLVLAALLALPFGASRAAGQTGGASDSLFDGAKARGAVSVGPAGGTLSVAGPAAADPDGLDAGQRALLDGLLARVELKPGADPRAPAALHQTFVTVVRTPTGAEMAARFIAENARAVVEFGAVENSAPIVVNGKKVLFSSGGNTQTNKKPPVVTINQDYLETDPAWRVSRMAATLGHELFGHGLERQRADQAGVTESLNHYRGDEANAGMLGWLIGIEAGAPTDNEHMWNYLQDPEVYHKKLEATMAYYALTFSVEDMKDPLATLQARRDRVGEARKSLQDKKAATDAWRPVIEHFVDVHGARSEDFKNLRDSIDGEDSYAAAQQKEYDHIELYIDANAHNWRGSGAPALAAISREAGSPYYVGTEERLEVLRRRLKDLTAGRSPEPTAPPVPGQITWSQLTEMFQKDKTEHPEHWPK